MKELETILLAAPNEFRDLDKWLQSFPHFTPQDFDHLKISAVNYYRIPLVCEAHSAILLAWPPGATTAIHNHPFGSIFLILAGELQEQAFVFENQQLVPAGIRLLTKGDATRESPEEIHLVNNPGPNWTWSLHLCPQGSSLQGTLLYEEKSGKTVVLPAGAKAATWEEFHAQTLPEILP